MWMGLLYHPSLLPLSDQVKPCPLSFSFLIQPLEEGRSPTPSSRAADPLKGPILFIFLTQVAQVKPFGDHGVYDMYKG